LKKWWNRSMDSWTESMTAGARVCETSLNVSHPI
jgi:hypothetical protein